MKPLAKDVQKAYPSLAVFARLWYNKGMEKLLTDVHNHTRFSPDGQDAIEEMLAAARERGVAYYGISEHFDYDYKVNNIPFYGGASASYTDPELYFSRARALKAAYAGQMEVLVGGEFGYTDNHAAFALYAEVIDKYSPDFVVNSVHTDGRADYSTEEAYLDKNGGLRPKEEVYREYFSLVKKSLEAPYSFDIVGHLGFCTRYAPYGDKRARYEEYRSEIDGILLRIIAKDKILEVNGAGRGGASEFLPDRDILKRYYRLGGRKVSYASDAHSTPSILRNREKIAAALKEIGFTCVTVPVREERIETAL